MKISDPFDFCQNPDPLNFGYIISNDYPEAAKLTTNLVVKIVLTFSFDNKGKSNIFFLEDIVKLVFLFVVKMCTRSSWF